MASHTSTSVQAACAESLGLFVASLTDSKKLSDADSGLAVQIAEGLLRMLCMLCSAAVAPVKETVRALPDLLHMDCLPRVQSAVTQDEQAEAVFGIMAGKSSDQCFCNSHHVGIGPTTVPEQLVLRVTDHTHCPSIHTLLSDTAVVVLA